MPLSDLSRIYECIRTYSRGTAHVRENKRLNDKMVCPVSARAVMIGVYCHHVTLGVY